MGSFALACDPDAHTELSTISLAPHPLRCNRTNAFRVLKKQPDVERSPGRGGETVSDKDKSGVSALSPDTGHGCKRKIRPASDVGVSLTVSKEALKEIDRLQQEMSKAVRAAHQYAWR